MSSDSKTFDAVAFQRQARETLSLRYLEDPELFLEKLRAKYGPPTRRNGTESIAVD